MENNSYNMIKYKGTKEDYMEKRGIIKINSYEKV